MPTTQQDFAARNFKTPVVNHVPIDLSKVDFLNGSLYDQALDKRLGIVEKAVGTDEDFNEGMEAFVKETESYKQRVAVLESQVTSLNAALTKVLGDLAVIKPQQ